MYRQTFGEQTPMELDKVSTNKSCPPMGGLLKQRFNCICLITYDPDETCELMCVGFSSIISSQWVQRTATTSTPLNKSQPLQILHVDDVKQYLVVL